MTDPSTALRERYLPSTMDVHRQLFGLKGLGLSIATFYGMPPWQSNGKPDLDMVLAYPESNVPIRSDVESHLADLYGRTGNLPFDVWYCSEEELLKRMKRIPFKSQPHVFTAVFDWDGFGFVPKLGRDELTRIVLDAFSHPEVGGPIPEDPSQKIRIPGMTGIPLEI